MHRHFIIQKPVSTTLMIFQDRALKLSATCLKLNPANYTVWNFRRQCLQSLGLISDKAAVQEDLDLAASLGGSNPKNYQVRNRRRGATEQFETPTKQTHHVIPTATDILGQNLFRSIDLVPSQSSIGNARCSWIHGGGTKLHCKGFRDRFEELPCLVLSTVDSYDG